MNTIKLSASRLARIHLSDLGLLWCNIIFKTFLT
ncbi:unnamed protein product [Acanthoscelides obtectus]|uniref:Uncharacterized protein n=1 Tax=Acanthoscelides obtectus TaxID=200917 RepID=A0A9P0LJ99_ACAOB|nr:unnamed protein product [Acanthoscelides obtectus]CAK1623187.1 hypothetical protein AOBTE_LOCUS1869 [Acanthoscelides obtectus]